LFGYGKERRKKMLAGSPANDIDQKERKWVAGLGPSPGHWAHREPSPHGEPAV
jgi:hypothetical protein